MYYANLVRTDNQGVLFIPLIHVMYTYVYAGAQEMERLTKHIAINRLANHISLFVMCSVHVWLITCLI